jgi:hypothetical protein
MGSYFNVKVMNLAGDSSLPFSTEQRFNLEYYTITVDANHIYVKNKASQEVEGIFPARYTVVYR